jgi:hypothetical protein
MAAQPPVSARPPRGERIPFGGNQGSASSVRKAAVHVQFEQLVKAPQGYPSRPSARSRPARCWQFGIARMSGTVEREKLGSFRGTVASI